MPSQSAERSLEAAERAFAAVHDYPLRAEAAALELLGEAAVGEEATSLALHTAGLVARETGRLSIARRRLRRAIAVAEAGGLRHRMTQARLSLALVLLQDGKPTAALAELDLASTGAPQQLRGQVLAQQALVHIRLGRFDAALDDSRRALPLLRRGGDQLNEARLLSNRGVLRAYRNELGLAEADLNKALKLYESLGSEISAAQVLHNLGYVSALRGDVPAALRRYDMAARPFSEQGLVAPALAIDRAELYLSARLVPKARLQVELGVASLQASGNALDLAEARLLLSQIALVQGDMSVAGAAARSARRTLFRQGRTRWATLARFLEAQARWSHSAPGRIAAEAVGLAEELHGQGWLLESVECRVLGARAALQIDDRATARDLVGAVDGAGRSGPATYRVRACYAEALGRLAAQNRVGALAALRAGLGIAEAHRSSLGATELRVRTATAVSELAELGVGIALDSKRALAVLAWSERWRAGALRSPRAKPPDDEPLARLLMDLRDTARRLDRAPLGPAEAHALADSQRLIEEKIRRHSHGAVGGVFAAPRLPSAAELRQSVGDRVLVEYLEHAGQLHAVVVDNKCFRLRHLGSSARAESERITGQFALGRLALSRCSPASLEAAAALLERSCRRLAALLVEPLLCDLAGRDMILVPTGALHAVSWALLPPLRGISVTVSPSAALWHSRESHEPRAAGPADPGSVLLVAGPGVAKADEETRRIRAASYKGARLMRGARATVASVMQALEGCRVAHVAAHGTFRADNPQFSSLELADGPLTVYDLEQIATPPRWMILSACYAGRSSVNPGNELMGTSAALLSLGTRAIVASAVPLPDDGVASVMVALHRQLATGCGLARSLAAAQSQALPPGLEFGDLVSGAAPSREALAAAALVCLGAG